MTLVTHDHHPMRPDPPTGSAGETRSLGDLFRTLTTDASTLMRSEMALARMEIRRNVAAVASHAGLVLVGGILAALGGLVLLAALVAFLGDVMGDRYALAALIVGVVLVAAGAFLGRRGIKQIRAGGLAPTATIQSLRETRQWARDEVASRGNAAPLVRNGTAPLPATHRLQEGASRPAPTGKPAPADRAEEALPASAPLWKRVWHEYKQDDIANEAAKVAYYFFLSLPPALMALFGLAGMFGGQKIADWLTAKLETALPGEARQLVDEFVQQIVHEKAPGPLTIGLLLAIWAASNIMMALEDTLNTVYDVRCERSFVKRRLLALGVLLGVGLLFLAGSAALLAGPAISRALGLGPLGDTIWAVAQWPLAFSLIVGAFWLLYYFLPNTDQSGCKKTLVKSSAIAATLWLLATAAFKLYIANFSSYSASYGMLGTIIVLLLWLYLTGLVILLGGEISSELERTV